MDSARTDYRGGGWARALIVTGVCAALSACGGAQARYADHLARGERFLADGNLTKASLEFRNAMQVAPKQGRGYVLAGRVAELSGDFRTAVARYQNAVDLDADDLDAVAGLARLQVMAGQSERALAILKPALARHPDDPALLTARSAARNGRHDDVGARADAERAVALAPDREESLALLATLLAGAGERAAAVGVITSALSRNPRSTQLREALVRLYVLQEDRSGVERELRQLVEVDPSRVERRYALARVLADYGRLDAAQQVLEEAVAHFPAQQETKLVLVDFLATRRSREEGESVLRRYIASEPANLDLRLGLGALLERSGAVSEALAVYRDVIARDRIDPHSLVARDRIAAREAAAGHAEEAASLVREVLARNPADTDAILVRANLALERGDATAAVEDLRAVLREQPAAPGVRRELARAHLLLGEPQLAEEALRKALDYTPADTGVRVDLAELLAQTDRLDAAAALLEEGVRGSPRDAPLREALVRNALLRRDFPAARGSLDTLHTLLPDSPVVPTLRGAAALAEGHPQDAERSFVEAIQLDPEAVEPLAALARLEVARGRGSVALTRIRGACDARPQSAMLRNLLGEFLERSGQHAAAAEAFRTAGGLAPRWWVPWRNLALVERSAGRFDAAIAADETALRLAPVEPTLVVDLATLYEQARRVDDAVRAYEALLARRPRQPVAANNLAMLLLTYRTDRTSLERAAALTAPFAESSNAALLDTYGWSLYKLGKFSDALHALEKAAAVSDSRVVSYHLGMAQYQTGRSADARTSLETAVAAGPRFAGLDEATSILALLRKTSG